MKNQFQVIFGNQSNTYVISVAAEDEHKAFKKAESIGKKKYNPNGYVQEVSERNPQDFEYELKFKKTGASKDPWHNVWY